MLSHFPLSAPLVQSLLDNLLSVFKSLFSSSNIMNIREMDKQSIIISHFQFNFTMNTFDPTFVPSIFSKICPNFWLQIQTSIAFLTSTNIMRIGEVIN